MNYRDSKFFYVSPAKDKVATPIGEMFQLEPHDCGVDLFLMDIPFVDRVGKVRGVCVITQNDDETTSILDDCPAICMSIYGRLVLAAGFGDITPSEIVWILNFPPTQEKRFGSMERVYFENTLVCKRHLTVKFAGPAWYSIARDEVEGLLGFKWDQMFLPAVRRWVG